MGNRLYVGNLAYRTDDDRLRAAFVDSGTVLEAKVIVDRETGQSKGFGFVTFTNEADAQNALTSMDGADVDGRQLRVREAEERPTRGGGGGRRPEPPEPEVFRNGAPRERQKDEGGNRPAKRPVQGFRP